MLVKPLSTPLKKSLLSPHAGDGDITHQPYTSTVSLSCFHSFPHKGVARQATPDIQKQKAIGTLTSYYHPFTSPENKNKMYKVTYRGPWDSFSKVLFEK